MAKDEINRDYVRAKDVFDVGIDGYKYRKTVASATVHYIGKAKIGSATTSAVWSIARQTLNADGILIALDYANGDEFDVYNKIFDNASGYSYS